MYNEHRFLYKCNGKVPQNHPNHLFTSATALHKGAETLIVFYFPLVLIQGCGVAIKKTQKSEKETEAEKKSTWLLGGSQQWVPPTFHFLRSTSFPDKPTPKTQTSVPCILTCGCHRTAVPDQEVDKPGKVLIKENLSKFSLDLLKERILKEFDGGYCPVSNKTKQNKSREIIPVHI